MSSWSVFHEDFTNHYKTFNGFAASRSGDPKSISIVEGRLACSACKSLPVQGVLIEDRGGLRIRLEVACKLYNTLLHAEQKRTQATNFRLEEEKP
jgi:hypothetical protein